MMYLLPDMDNTNVTYVIDEDAVRNNVALADLTRRRTKESA